MPARRGPGGARGFTLVELVVALALLEVLLLGALGLLRLAAARVARAETMERAVWVASAVADSLAAGRGAGGRAEAWGSVEVDAREVVAIDSAGRELVRVPIR